MRKKVFGRKLGRSRPTREALFASLARSMILNGKIVTTRAKAKAVQGNIEKFVRLAKKGDTNSLRKILSSLDNARDAVSALSKKVAPAFSGRLSGFTRIVLLPSRKGDMASMVRMEWTENIEPEKEIKKEKAKDKKVKVAKKTKSKDNS